MAIPAWLTSLYPNIATKLTTLRNDALTFYVGQPEEIIFLNDAFLIHDGLLDAYKTVDRTNVFDTLVNSLYSYLGATRNLGGTPIDESGFPIENLFDMNGLETWLDGKIALGNYYQDLVESGPGTGIFTSADVDESTIKLTNLASDEDTYILSVVSQMNAVVKKAVNYALFNDITPPVTPLGKQGIGEYIFNTLNYKFAITEFNIDFDLPPYITP